MSRDVPWPITEEQFRVLARKRPDLILALARRAAAEGSEPQFEPIMDASGRATLARIRPFRDEVVHEAMEHLRCLDEDDEEMPE